MGMVEGVGGHIDGEEEWQEGGAGGGMGRVEGEGVLEGIDGGFEVAGLGEEVSLEEVDLGEEVWVDGEGEVEGIEALLVVIGEEVSPGEGEEDITALGDGNVRGRRLGALEGSDGEIGLVEEEEGVSGGEEVGEGRMREVWDAAE